jgi:hypothetical protein
MSMIEEADRAGHQAVLVAWIGSVELQPVATSTSTVPHRSHVPSGLKSARSRDTPDVRKLRSPEAESAIERL